MHFYTLSNIKFKKSILNRLRLKISKFLEETIPQPFAVLQMHYSSVFLPKPKYN